MLWLILLAWPAGAEVPEQVEIGGLKVRLQVFAWRDFMPQIGGEGSGSPLMLTPSLVDEGGQPLPGVTFKEIVATCEGKEWRAVPDSGGTARGGPRWPTGASVMVQAHYSYKGKDGWLRLARPAGIGRTE
ncbi:MAG: hypothetical protein KF760_30805 [Candidatus Eremiobacteraeota bacterium]|nr:hypothetical protein [Candidatus Eremiobacteraeota bacterium]